MLVVRGDATGDDYRKKLRISLDLTRLVAPPAAKVGPGECPNTLVMINGKVQHLGLAQRIADSNVEHLRCIIEDHKRALYVMSLLASADQLRFRACGGYIRAGKKELALLRRGAREVLGQFQALYIPELGGPSLPVKVP